MDAFYKPIWLNQDPSLDAITALSDKMAPEHFAHSQCLHSLNFDN